ncbi:hypothetical protein DL766_001681 [Monosporascus sp. MC13-8B]|uniref:Uncharacterized protein n=1 Tax=Monosporascus cannonballus TaxID=155416 RepID=A0ABY0H802_9PEZI|nr:hypothetical protein DL762_005448 [Monosporascus cannonballus]RYO90187.1 hypothetical protein DL763_005428 [Monosporascus cannonballus]RYP37107.1 hypothetical protein DL766_001681 [Monosporascus sp. MC13-8B]
MKRLSRYPRPQTAHNVPFSAQQQLCQDRVPLIGVDVLHSIVSHTGMKRVLRVFYGNYWERSSNFGADDVREARVHPSRKRHVHVSHFPAFRMFNSSFCLQLTWEHLGILGWNETVRMRVILGLLGSLHPS